MDEVPVLQIRIPSELSLMNQLVIAYSSGTSL